MKCIECNGTGKSKYGYNQPCTYCDGKGFTEPMTNEEYIRTCSVEELATVIYGIAAYDTLYDRIHNAVVLNPCEDDSAGINEVMKWLEEKNT